MINWLQIERLRLLLNGKWTPAEHVLNGATPQHHHRMDGRRFTHPTNRSNLKHMQQPYTLHFSSSVTSSFCLFSSPFIPFAMLYFFLNLFFIWSSSSIFQLLSHLRIVCLSCSSSSCCITVHHFLRLYFVHLLNYLNTMFLLTPSYSCDKGFHNIFTSYTST